MMRISNKLTKKTTKTEEFKKLLELYNIINFENICNKMAALGNINPLILNYKLLRPVSILRLPKDSRK